MPIAQNQFMGRGEFIALMAMMFATIAFSIDAMLPAIPQIANEIAGGDRAKAAWVLTSFVAGMGLGTFFAGPLSDALLVAPPLSLTKMSIVSRPEASMASPMEPQARSSDRIIAA